MSRFDLPAELFQKQRQDRQRNKSGSKLLKRPIRWLKSHKLDTKQLASNRNHLLTIG